MGQPLVHEEMFVGRHLREEAFHVGVLRRLLIDQAHGSRRIAEYFPVFRRPHDADIVDLVQPCNDDGDVFVRQSGDAFLKVLLEFFDLLCLCQRVIVVIGLEVLVDAVLLCLDGLVGFVDGEVELGNERAVHPRFADVVTELRAAGAWQEPHDQHHTQDDEHNARA